MSPKSAVCIINNISISITKFLLLQSTWDLAGYTLFPDKKQSVSKSFVFWKDTHYFLSNSDAFQKPFGNPWIHVWKKTSWKILTAPVRLVVIGRQLTNSKIWYLFWKLQTYAKLFYALKMKLFQKFWDTMYDHDISFRIPSEAC